MLHPCAEEERARVRQVWLQTGSEQSALIPNELQKTNRLWSALSPHKFERLLGPFPSPQL